MPFYEYQCQACGAQVEVLQKISDAPLKKCPECGKSRLAKLVSAPVFRLKGGGWYETDFKGEKENKRNLVETEKAEPKSEDTPKTDSKPEAKAEAKPEAKPEAKSEAKPARKISPKPVAKSVKKTAAKRKARR
ncbi:MAG TPA: FmdB family zinc ribbon protein [Steroidobacteraceae bacterium]|nr:FmdB family zinc ribbon protein [Steroidobacteraceae bacterium]